MKTTFICIKCDTSFTTDIPQSFNTCLCHDKDGKEYTQTFTPKVNSFRCKCPLCNSVMESCESELVKYVLGFERVGISVVKLIKPKIIKTIEDIVYDADYGELIMDGITKEEASIIHYIREKKHLDNVDYVFDMLDQTLMISTTLAYRPLSCRCEVRQRPAYTTDIFNKGSKLFFQLLNEILEELQNIRLNDGGETK